MIRSILLALPFAGLAFTASAHTKSETTTPADGATVTEVSELTMRFDDPMRIIAATLTSDGVEVGIEPETGMDPVTEWRAVPADDLSPGTYRLEWRGMAEDGHPMQGGFGFTVSE